VKTLLRFGVVVAGILIAASAYAIPITQGGSISLTFPAPPQNTHLGANATVTLPTLTSTNAILDITIHNTSSGDIGFTDRLTAFGFQMSPAPTPNATLPVAFVAGTNALTQAATPDGVPSFKQVEDVCAFAGANCSAGNTGLTAGLSDEFRITLAGTYNATVGLDLSNFAIKWTDCTGCSFEIAGVVTGGGGGQVPEPSALFLLGAGVTALGAIGWRRTRR
jgi:PEP-CTERM motif-containing protein